MRPIPLFLILVLLTLPVVAAATLKGTIYNTQLNPEQNVLVEISTSPPQKYLSRDGSYAFELASGSYTLTAQKGTVIVEERINILSEGTYIYDLFLLPGFAEEDDLWNDSTQELLEEESTAWWRYAIAGAIALFALYRIGRARKKYGPLRIFRKRVKEDAAKSVEQHKAELAQEPGHLDKAMEIIRKNDGRLTQKELRKEMLYLSEAKVSLIVTELEHKGLIEKVKKGRGNVLLWKGA